MSRTTACIALAVLGLAAALPVAAETGGPKPRSSSPSGIEVRSDVPAARPMATTGSAAAAQQPSHSPSAPDAAGPGGAGAAVSGPSGGSVGIIGNTVTNANGSDLNTATVGQSNAGCTQVGTISGRKC